MLALFRQYWKTVPARVEYCNAGKESCSTGSPAVKPSSADGDTNIADEEHPFAPICCFSQFVPQTASHLQQLKKRTTRRSERVLIPSTRLQIKHKTSQLLEAVTSSSSDGDIPVVPRFAALVEAYASSPIAAQINADMEEIVGLDDNGELRDVVEEGELRRQKRASWYLGRKGF